MDLTSSENRLSGVSCAAISLRDAVCNYWAIGLFAVAWLDLARQLSYTWATKEQYSYGWFVPFFSLYLICAKWTQRPVPQPGRQPWWLSALAAVATIGYLPVRMVHEANPDWPLISYLLTGLLIALTLYAFWAVGGMAWVRHFAFPVMFMFVAVEWPWRIEYPLTQSLMQVVANVTIEVLGIVGIPAVQHGNLIEVSTGVLGVHDACSGIRSLQSSVMAALFFGEMYRWRFTGRILLLTFGIGLAFVFNLLRTFLLAWQAANGGVEEISKWHDSAGYAIAIACFLSLWLAAAWTKQQVASVVRSVSPATGGPMGRRRLAYLGLGLVSLIAVNECWYRYHEAQRRHETTWSIRVPENLRNVRTIPFSERETQLLQHDSAITGMWSEPDGSKWAVYLLRWDEGSMLSRIKARGHRPEVCLPASGRTLLGRYGETKIVIHGLSIPFRRLTFGSEGSPTHVFFCLWENGGEKLGRTETLSVADRLAAVTSGKRRLGQQTLEVIVEGYPNLEKAEEAFRRQLLRLIEIIPSNFSQPGRANFQNTGESQVNNCG